jgi:hypothetical protein
MRSQKNYGGHPQTSDMQHDVPRFTATLFLTNTLGGDWRWSEEYQQMTAHFSLNEVPLRMKEYLQNLSIHSDVSADKSGFLLTLDSSSYSRFRKTVQEGIATDLQGQPLKDSKKPLASLIAAELKQESRGR